MNDEDEWSTCLDTEPEPAPETLRPVDIAKMMVLCPAAFFAAFYVVETLKGWFFY